MQATMVIAQCKSTSQYTDYVILFLQGFSLMWGELTSFLAWGEV